MSDLPAIALSNLMVAGVIACLAVLCGLWLRRPALTHGLWLLFFVKLVTPPLLSFPVFVAADVQISLPEPNLARAALPAWTPPPDDEPQPLMERKVLAAPFAEPNDAGEASEVFVSAGPGGGEIAWPQAVTWLCLAGSFCWLSLAGWRLFRFRRQLRLAQAAPEALVRQAQELALRLKVSCPEVHMLSAAVAPMLLVSGRKPRLLLPAGLLERLDSTQMRAVLAHELAHWRRGDHWVRRLEMIILALYWWCPAVWWARRQMQEAEEECCDAWVVWLMPTAARSYALALVETTDFLAGARVPLPQAASGIGRVRLLKRRLTMIMREKPPRALSLGGAFAVLSLGALLLPLMPTWAQEQPARSRAGGGAPGLEEPREPPKNQFKAEQHDLEAMQQDIRRAEIELERARATLEQNKAQLHIRMQTLERDRRMAEFNRAKQQALPVLPPPPRLDMPPGHPPALEQRLQQLERKLDMVLDIMRQRGNAPGALGFPGAAGHPPATKSPPRPPREPSSQPPATPQTSESEAGSPSTNDQPAASRSRQVR